MDGPLELTGLEMHTKEAGPLRIAGRFPNSENKSTNDIYETNGDWLVKVWKPFEDRDDWSRGDVARRYVTFSQLRFAKEPALACLPWEYLLVEQRPAYLMRRAEAEDLATAWRHRRLQALPLIARLRIGRNVAQALHLLHQRGVVHGDIKLSNFCGDLETSAVYILDVDDGGYIGSPRGLGQFAPTTFPVAPYLSPELANELTTTGSWGRVWTNPPLRTQPDLWALAVLLYQLLTLEQHPLPTAVFGPGRPSVDWPLPQQRERFAQLGLDNDLLPIFGEVFCEAHRCDPTYSRPMGYEWKRFLQEAIDRQG